MVLLALLWILFVSTILVGLIIPVQLYQRVWGTVTNGHFVTAKHTLLLAMDHLIDNPDEWHVNSDLMKFPKQGSVQIAFHKDRKTGRWDYQMGGEELKAVHPFYAAKVDTYQRETLKKREFYTAARSLYPQETQLLLESRGFGK